MLELRHNEQFVRMVREGGWFDTPHGRTGAAHAGWERDGWELVEHVPPAQPEPTPEELLEQDRAAMSLSFRQLLIGLVAEGWITEAEGEAWLVGTIPAPALAVINALPPEHRFAAKASAIRPSVVLRTDPLVIALAQAEEKTPEDMDTFFRAYAAV